ncbi:hypothetical protein ZWY2020_039124, partial [Hordeum vulgare]
KNVVAWWEKVTNISWLQSIELLFVIASGLPTTDDFEHVTDLQILKAPP